MQTGEYDVGKESIRAHANGRLRACPLRAAHRRSRTGGKAKLHRRDYLTNIVEVDIQNLGSRRDPDNLRRLLAALGRAVGQAAKGSELGKEVGGVDGPIAKETLAAYLTALSRLHLLDNSKAWLPHMRSRARLRTAPVRYYEALVMRDLRVYAQLLDARVDSWRDSNGNEVDAIITAGPSKWGAFEVKLTPDAVDEGATSLLRFAASVDTSRHGKPSCLGVITSSGAGGRRDDGVHVIPIGCLGP